MKISRVRHNTINVTNTTSAAFKKMWRDISADWTSCSASKYCDARFAFNTGVITAPNDTLDALDEVQRAIQAYTPPPTRRFYF